MRERVFAAVTLVLSSTFCLGVLEVAARGLDSWRTRRRLQPPALDLMRENPAGTGSFRLKPNLDLLTTVKGKTVRIQTNSQGMRWREVALARRPSQRRVAVLGDSFTFGCWADSVEESYVGILDRELPPRFEVLNFGVGGYGLKDEELILREQVLAFEPDVVLVGFFDGNDVRDTFLGLQRYDVEVGTANLRHDVLEKMVPPPWSEDDGVVSGPSRDPSALRAALKEHSTLARLVLPLTPWDHLGLQFKASRHFLKFTFWPRHPWPEVALRARDDTLATLGRMQESLAAKGILLGVVAIPMREQVYAVEEAGRDYDIAFPQAWVQAFARERGIPYLDLLPPLREHVAETNRQLYLEADIHFNNEGHALAGALVARWFRTVILGRRPM